MNEQQEKVEQSRTEKIIVPAVLTGLFVIWPAVNLASVYYGYKTVKLQHSIAIMVTNPLSK